MTDQQLEARLAVVRREILDLGCDSHLSPRQRRCALENMISTAKLVWVTHEVDVELGANEDEPDAPNPEG